MYYAMVWVFVSSPPLQSYTEIWTPKWRYPGMGLLGGTQIVRALLSWIVNAISVLMQEAPGHLPRHVCHVRMRGDVWPARQPTSAPASTLICDLPSPGLEEVSFCGWWAAQSVEFQVIEPEWTKTCYNLFILFNSSWNNGRCSYFWSWYPCTHVCFAKFNDKKWNFWVRGFMYLQLKWVLPNCLTNSHR